MAKSKQKINEDILEMGRLMNYNRGLTNTENTVLFEDKTIKKQPMNEALAGAVAAIAGALPMIGGAGLGYLWYRTIKNYLTKLGSNKKFNLGMGKVAGDYLYETEPFEVEGIDMLDDAKVDELVAKFDEAMDGGVMGLGTDEDKIYEGIKGCRTVVGMSQVAARYQSDQGQDLFRKLVGEMRDDKTELNRMFSIAERLPLLGYKGKPIKDLAMLKDVVEEEKTKDTETSRESFAVDYDLIKIDDQALPFDYAMTPEAEAKFNQYLDTAKYVKKYTPEFLAAQAIAKTSPVEVSIEFPGDGKIVAVVDEFQEQVNITEGKISGDGKGNITRSTSDDSTDDKSTDDKSGDDKSGDDKSGTKKSGGSSWRKAPESEPTKGDKSTFVSKGHYNKNEGSTVKKIQKALGVKEDGLYGPGTKAAVEKYQKENGLNVDGVVGADTWAKMNVSGGKAGATGKEEVTKAEENELDKITVEKEKVDPTTLKDQIDDLKAAVSKQPTKESCKELIATAAAGLKAGVRLNDSSSLAQCYNSYNFGWGGKSKKVRKAYKLKTQGN